MRVPSSRRGTARTWAGTSNAESGATAATSVRKESPGTVQIPRVPQPAVQQPLQSQAAPAPRRARASPPSMKLYKLSLPTGVSQGQWEGSAKRRRARPCVPGEAGATHRRGARPCCTPSSAGGPQGGQRTHGSHWTSAGRPAALGLTDQQLFIFCLCLFILPSHPRVMAMRLIAESYLTPKRKCTSLSQ